MEGALLAGLTMEPYGGPVRLVPDVLQHEQRLRSPRDHQRIRAVREVDLLEPLRQADVWDRQAELLEYPGRLRELSAPAVDDHEGRRVREPTSPAILGSVLLVQQPR